MGQFIVIGRDGAGGLERRKGARPAHLEHWGKLDADGRVVYAGPLLNNEKPIGSVVIFIADSVEEAQGVVQGDPYVVQGVFATTELFPIKQVLPGT